MKASHALAITIVTVLGACDPGADRRPPSGPEIEQRQQMEQDKKVDPRELDEIEIKDQERREVNANDQSISKAKPAERGTD